MSYPRATTVAPARDAAGSQGVDRLASLVFGLAAAGGSCTVAELAERAELPVSSTYRLVQALERHGLVTREERHEVALGLGFLELARHVEKRLELTLLEPCRPVMEGLARTHRETVLLTARVGASALGIASVESPRTIRLSFARWELLPLHRGASGRVLLAWLDPGVAEPVIAAVADDDPALDTTALRRDLAAARERGYAITHGDLDPGASAVAVPILDGRGKLVAGLTVAGPTARIRSHEHEIIAGVTTGARTIAEALAGRSREPAPQTHR